jgi:hypothetical protein
MLAKDPTLEDQRGKSRAERPFKCDQCDKTFSNKNSIYTHRKTVHDVQFIECPHEGCAVKVKSENSYRMWEHSFEHRGFMPYNCTKCSYKIASKTRWDSLTRLMTLLLT